MNGPTERGFHTETFARVAGVATERQELLECCLGATMVGRLRVDERAEEGQQGIFLCRGWAGSLHRGTASWGRVEVGGLGGGG